MKNNVWIYIAVMGAVSFLIRVLPMTLIRKPIKSRFVRSFLYYVPYVTLAVMTFPAVLDATQSPIAGGAALAVGMIVAWFGFDLFKTALSCCAIVLILELFIK
ncbi:MAG: AzlD domain-containing protein [Ruminococcaceae bacterium]|nr:AzlD domain-containing protein [Oscillospiraceae bacterium]